MAKASGTYLTTLPDKQKFELCLVRVLQGMTYRDLAQYVKDTWDQEVSKQSVGNFFNSEEGAQMLDDAYEHLRREYANEPIIEKSTRVMALREQAQKLQKLLRQYQAETDKWLEYSQEFRQYVKQIAVEMEGIQVNVSEGKSAAELAVEAAMAKRKKLELVRS